MFDKLYNSLKVILLSIEVSMLKPFSYKEAGVLGEKPSLAMWQRKYKMSLEDAVL